MMFKDRNEEKEGFMDSSGIHGSSAMLELGWQVKPSERSSWMVDVGAVGWVGHQKGVAFQVQMKKAF